MSRTLRGAVVDEALHPEIIGDYQAGVVYVGASEPVKLERQPWPDPSHTSPRRERTQEFAYEIAVRQGFVGSRDEWLEYLRGPQNYTPRHHATIQRQSKARKQRLAAIPDPLAAYRDPNRPLERLTDHRHPVLRDDLWLKAQVQLSLDVAAEIERTRVPVPAEVSNLRMFAVTTAYLLLLVLALLASA